MTNTARHANNPMPAVMLTPHNPPGIQKQPERSGYLMRNTISAVNSPTYEITANCAVNADSNQYPAVTEGKSKNNNSGKIFR